MDLRRAAVMTAGVLALAALAVPRVATAQDCTGKKPKGGRYVTSAELYFNRASKYPQSRQKLYQQAVDVLEQGFERQPDNPKNYALAGRAYAMLGRYTDADRAFSRAEEMWSCYAAEIDTMRFRAWVPAFNRGIQYSEQGNLEKAIHAYSDAWTVYNKLPQPQLQIGGIYANMSAQAETEEARLDAQERAIDAYRKALDALAARPERLTAEQQQEYGRAAAFNLAQLLAFEERYAEAVEAYEMYLVQDPGNIDAMSNAAVVMVRASRQAERQAEDMEDGPEKEALLAKADSLRENATDYYNELLAREDLDAEEYHNIGLGLARIHMNEQAATAFTKALDLEPYRLNSLDQLARVLFAAQRYDTLAVVAEKLVERYPLSLDNLALLANAYRELDQVNDALALLERREALQVQLVDLELEGKEGVYTVSGKLENLKAEPNSNIEIQFDFYDDAGTIVASARTSVATPEPEAKKEFSVSTESSALISGVTYELADSAQASTGG